MTKSSKTSDQTNPAGPITFPYSLPQQLLLEARVGDDQITVEIKPDVPVDVIEEFKAITNPEPVSEYVESLIVEVTEEANRKKGGKKKPKNKEEIATQLKAKVHKKATSRKTAKPAAVKKEEPKPIAEADKHIVPTYPTPKDWPFAINTPKLKVDAGYLKYRMRSLDTNTILEAIDLVGKIAADPIYNEQATYQLIRGLNDIRSSVRNACIDLLGRFATNSYANLMEIERNIWVATNHLRPEEIKSYQDKTDAMIKRIETEGPMRSCMIRIHNNAHRELVRKCAERLPEFYILYTDHKR